MFTHMSQNGDNAAAIGLGPMLGYFYDVNPMREEIRGSLYPYILAFVNYEHMDWQADDYSILNMGGKIGLAAMISEAVALDFGARLTSVSYKQEDAPESVKGAIIWIGAGITAFIY